MYRIFACIWPKLMVHIGKSSIHGAYGVRSMESTVFLKLLFFFFKLCYVNIRTSQF